MQSASGSQIQQELVFRKLSVYTELLVQPIEISWRKIIMQWKNIGMGKKLGIGFGFVILLLLGISTISQTGFKQLASAIDESVYFNELQTIMLQREIDHMNWQNKVIFKRLSCGDWIDYLVHRRENTLVY
jgi:hypothetical protein